MAEAFGLGVPLRVETAAQLEPGGEEYQAIRVVSGCYGFSSAFSGLAGKAGSVFLPRRRSSA